MVWCAALILDRDQNHNPWPTDSHTTLLDICKLACQWFFYSCFTISFLISISFCHTVTNYIIGNLCSHSLILLWFLPYMCWTHFFFLTLWQLNISCNMCWWFIFHFCFIIYMTLIFDRFRNMRLHVPFIYISFPFTSFLLCFKDMCFTSTFHTCCILACVCSFPCFYLAFYMRLYYI